jgi:hypothetical protein
MPELEKTLDTHLLGLVLWWPFLVFPRHDVVLVVVVGAVVLTVVVFVIVVVVVFVVFIIGVFVIVLFVVGGIIIV